MSTPYIVALVFSGLSFIVNGYIIVDIIRRRRRRKARYRF